MVSPAFSSSHCSGHKHLPNLRSSDYDIIQQVPPLEAGVHPGGFKLSLHTEQGVGDCEAVLTTEREKPMSIRVHVSDSVRADDIFPEV